MVKVIEVGCGDYEEVAGFLGAFGAGGGDGDRHFCYAKQPVPFERGGKNHPVPFFESAGWWWERLRWWWDLNPAFEEGFVRGWVLREGDGRMAGFMGNVPTRVLIGGVERVVCNTTTWRVLEASRGASLQLAMRRLAVFKEAMIFDTTSGADVARIMERLKFVRWPGDVEERVGSWMMPGGRRVLRAKGRGKREEGRGTRGGVAAAAAGREHDGSRRFFVGGRDAGETVKSTGKMVGGDEDTGKMPVLRGVMGLVGWLWEVYEGVRLRGLKVREGLAVRVVERAGEDFDGLWEATRGQYANTNVRTAAAVNWLCGWQVEGVRRVLLGCYRGERLVGYLVLDVTEHDGFRRGACLDLWVDEQESGVVASLVAFVREYGKREGIDLLVLEHFDSRVGEEVGRLKLMRRTVGAERRRYMRGPGVLVAAMEGGRSYWVAVQGDYGLV